MDRQLTPDFAEAVELSRNPFTRHDQVGAILVDKAMVGSDVYFLPDSKTVVRENDEGYVAVPMHTPSPLLGRRILKEIASTIEWIDNSVPMRTEGDK